MDEKEMSYQERASEYFAKFPKGPVPDSLFGAPVIDPELPPFWKPEVEGERRMGEVFAVRPTKDFGKGEGRGEAIHLRGPEGLFSIPVGANLKHLNWHYQIGMVFLFEFKGWQELEPSEDGEKTRCRRWIVRPLKQGHPGRPVVVADHVDERRHDEDVPF